MAAGAGGGARDVGEAVDADGPFLLVGLGNPGQQYAGNRHNVGFMIVDVLARRAGVRLRADSALGAEIGEGRLYPGGPRLVALRPLSYMNLSGRPTSRVARFFRIPVERVVALHDDLDLPYGTIRVKRGGGEGGHNGLRSLSQSLATRDYARVRFGIGRPPGRHNVADFVLRDFTTTERRELEYFVTIAADITVSIMERGIEATQNNFHGV